jgi:molybdate transport repressor ModE-like protein
MPGGGKGRGSTLTPKGKRLLEKYQLLKENIIKIADKEFAKIFGDPEAHDKQT